MGAHGAWAQLSSPGPGGGGTGLWRCGHWAPGTGSGLGEGGRWFCLTGCQPGRNCLVLGDGHRPPADQAVGRGSWCNGLPRNVLKSPLTALPAQAGARAAPPGFAGKDGSVVGLLGGLEVEAPLGLCAPPRQMAVGAACPGGPLRSLSREPPSHACWRPVPPTVWHPRLVPCRIPKKVPRPPRRAKATSAAGPWLGGSRVLPASTRHTLLGGRAGARGAILFFLGREGKRDFQELSWIQESLCLENAFWMLCPQELPAPPAASAGRGGGGAERPPVWSARE